jgi:hypothetical protein
MFNKLLNNLKNATAVPLLGILSDKLYQISSEKLNYQLIPAKKNKKFACILLSRQHYQEIQKSYPVESKKELVKILKLELKGEKRVSLYRIGDYKNKKRIVTFAYVNEKSLVNHTQLQQFMCIPESWLIGEHSFKKLTQVQSYKVPYWLYQSEENSQSQQVKGMFANAEAFCAAVGISYSEEPVIISESEVVALFRNTVVSILLKYNSGLWVSKSIKQTFNILQFTPAILGGGATLVIYLFSMSYYLDYQLNNDKLLQAQLALSASELFTLQKEIESKAEKISILEQNLLQPGVSLNMWENLNALYLIDKIRFRTVTGFADGEVNLMLKAPKATKILEQLSNQTGIYDAKFTSDVVQDKGIDSFSLSYRLEKVMDSDKNG